MSSSSRWGRRFQIIGAAVLLVALFVWAEGLLRHRIGPEDKVATRATPWSGAVTTATLRDVPNDVEVTGTVEPVRSALLSARIVGTVADVLVREGDRVKPGQELVRLAAPELKARSASAAGGVASAEAGLAQARRDLERMEALHARQAATEVELERARTAVAVSEAELSRARQSGRAESDVAAETVVRAPFDGLVLERRVDPGDLASPGTALLRIGDDSAFRLEAAVGERDAARLLPGSAARVVIEAIGLSAEGRVVEITPVADPASRTQVVKVELPKEAALRAGLFGRLQLPAGARRAVVVDARAVRRSGGYVSVRLVGEDGRLSMRAVRTGDAVPPDSIEILAGLAGGERLAIEEAP